MINHNLPKNWEVKTLAEVCTSKNSNIVLSSIENNTGKYPIYGAKGLLKTIDFYTIENESLGIVKDGAGVGRIFLLPEKSSLIGTMAYIQASKNLNLKYLYHFLHTINFNQYISGSAIPHIYFRDYKKEKIPLPPLATQKLIVEKLENAFAHIDEAVHHLKAVQTNIPRLKSSLLHSAFSGKLTESQNSSHKVQTLKSVVGEKGEFEREEGATSPFKPLHPLIKTEIPQGWEFKTLGEVCEFVYGKALNQTKRKTNGKYPVYAANGIKDYSDEFMISENSIIVGRKGSVGSVVLTSSPCWVLDVAYYVNFDKEKYNLVFLYHLLKYLNLKQFARGVKPGISRSQIYELQVVMPPLATQNQIVQILESKFTHLDNLAQFVNESLENLQKLKSSLLNQAFKGELIC